MSGEIFRFPISMRTAQGHDDLEKKSEDDIDADMDYRDLQLETFLSTLSSDSAQTGAWVADTATLTGAGWSLGNGTLSAQHATNGETVTYCVVFTLGTTTVGGAALGISLPALPSVIGSPVTTHILDASSGTRYGGVGYINSTYAFPNVSSTGGTVVGLTSVIPVAFSTGDVIAATVIFRKA